MANVLDLVKHYQHAIEKYSKDEQKILRSIDKLFNLDVTVQHLQETGVGRTVNALRKEPGTVGQAARALVYKWKLMVAAEESDQEDHTDTVAQNGNENGRDSDDNARNYSSNTQLKPEAVRRPSYNSENNLSNGDYTGGKRRYRSSEDDEPEVKKNRSNDDYETTKKSKSSDESETIKKSRNSNDYESANKSGNSKDETVKTSRSSNDHDTMKKSKSSYDHEPLKKSKSSDNSYTSNKIKSSNHNETAKEAKRTNNYDTGKKNRSSSEYETKPDITEKKEHSETYSEDSEGSYSSEDNSESNPSDDEEEYTPKKATNEEPSDRKTNKHTSHKSSYEKKREDYRFKKSSESSSKHESNLKSMEKYSSDKKEKSQSSHKHKSSKEKVDKNSKDNSTDKSKTERSSSKHKSGHNKHKSYQSDNDKEKHSSKDKHSSKTESCSSNSLELKSDKMESKKSSKKVSSDKIHKEKKSSRRNSKDEDGSSSKHKSKKKSSSSKEKSDCSDKSEKKQSSSDSKSKHDNGKNKSDKKIDGNSESKSKHKSSSNSSSHKTKSSSSHSKEKEPKKKVIVNSNTDSDDGIDCGSGATFAEALGMLSPAKPKRKDKALIRDEVSPTNRNCPDLSPAALLAPTAKLAPLPTLEISALPEISPNYKPRPPPKLLPHFTEEEAMSAVISSKNQRTKVYSGNKVIGKIPTLYEMCVQILQEHIDALEYTGGVPYDILKPVVDKATPQQLFMLEHYNNYLMEDTDHLWQKFCEKHFRTKQRLEMETWREMYMRCQEEQEHRLKSLTANIKIAQEAKKAPIKQTKMAYVDSIVKPPRSIARKQALHGTAHASTASPAARVASLATVPNVLRGNARPSSVVHVTSSFKPKKAPLMQKALQFMRGRKR
ncbi:hypothetical protein ACJJTC_016165 [Scirpophaga incertulas]